MAAHHVHVKDRSNSSGSRPVACDCGDVEQVILATFGMAEVAGAIPDGDDRRDFLAAIHDMQTAVDRSEWERVDDVAEYLAVDVYPHSGPVEQCSYYEATETR